MNDKQFPLFPELQEGGAEAAQKMIDRFKEELEKVARNVISETLGEFYSDMVTHIESDSWTNYRNELMQGFQNYGNRKIQGEHDFKEIRQSIFREFKDEIIDDLNQDNIERIKNLESQLESLWKSRY